MKNRTRNVLTLHFLGRKYPATQAVDAGIQAAFAHGVMPGEVEFFQEYLELPRFGQADSLPAFAAHLQSKYRGGVLPDVVIPVGGPSLEMLLERRETLFPGVPIVHCGADAGDRTPPVLPFLTGVMYGSRAATAETLRLALSLHPKRRHITVVGGVSEPDRGFMAEARICEAELRREGISLSYIEGPPPESLLRRLAALPDDDIVFYSGVYRDMEGKTHIPIRVLEALAPVANAPVYSIFSNTLGLGVVGGAMPRIDEGGEMAGRLTVRVLRGEKVSALAPVTVPRRPCLDARQLRRWSVPKHLLPPDAEIVFSAGVGGGGDALPERAALSERQDSLTRRERQMMALMVAGRSSKEIAAELGLSVVTVKIHRSHVLKKMDAPSLVALVRMADALSAPE